MLAHIRSLFGNLIIYGLGDVATSIASLLLLPIFTRYLSPEDYGVIAILLTVEAVTKVAFRWGVDTAFMRLFYDCRDQAARQRLASTIFLFLLVVNSVLALGGVLASGWLAVNLLDTSARAVLIALTIVNTFVAGFYFIPYHVLRISERSTQYIALSFTRSVGTIIARLLFVIVLGKGVMGIVMADVAVTAVFTLILSRWFAPLIRPVFSREILREALAFGLPRVPHSIAQQVISVADRYFLQAFGTLADVGLYAIGATFGLALKLFLSAFETAWTPFFLGLMHEKDAPRTYAMVSTYVVATLVLCVAGACALAPEVVSLFTAEAFHGAARVTPWIALGVMFQGFYLVGSIGLVITKRTALYPVSTGLAAAASVTANALLIPRYGMLGAAWANVIAYATLAGVTSTFSWRVYPIPYEWSRLVRVGAAGVAGYLAATLIGTLPGPPVLHLVLRGLIVVATYGLTLYVSGFFHAGELRLLRELRDRARRNRKGTIASPPPGEVEMAGEIIDSPSSLSDADSQDPRR